MTEDEAKTKWCPLARYVLDDSIGHGAQPGYPTGNRFAGHAPSEAQCKCIASACMAWRWADSGGFERRSFEVMGARPEGDGWECVMTDIGREKYVVKSQWRRTVPREGYCGLATRPQ